MNILPEGVPVDFAIAISAICLLCMVISGILRDWRMSRTALVVYLNWVALIEFNSAFGTTLPEWWLILIDAGAMAIILLPPASRWQAVIAAPFGAGVISHLLHIATGWPASREYWEFLTFLSVLQLGTLFAWGVTGGGKIARRVWRRYHPELPVEAPGHGLARGE